MASVLLLVACRPTPTATPIPPAPPLPAASPRPTSTAAPAIRTTPAATGIPGPTPSPSPTEDAYEGWQTVTTDDAVIRLPADWRVVDLSAGDAEAAFETLRQEQPFRAGLLNSSEALLETSLVVLAPEREGFADNLNIRRVALGAERLTDARAQVVDIAARQYEELGFAPEVGTDELRTEGGLPMAAVAFTLPPDGDAPAIRSRQFFVATESHLWILTFSALAERGERAFPVFEHSARSFATR